MKKTLCAALLVLGLSPAAHASTIVIDDGMTFTLTNLGIVSDATLGSAYKFVYQIDTAGWDGDAGAFIGGVSIKATSSSLTADNSKFVGTTAPGTWTVDFNAQANQGSGGAGCGGGGDGWICAEETTPGVPNATLGSSTYEWTFLLKTTLPLLSGVDAASIKAAYSTYSCTTRVVRGQTVETCGLASAGNTGDAITIGTPAPDTSAVPEPASLLLFGSGLGLMATRLRRNRQAA